MDINPKEFLDLMIKQAQNALDNMEGADLEDFIRFEKLYVAYDAIIQDLFKELKITPYNYTGMGKPC